MPGLDGYAVARSIRAGDRGRRMLLIAATGWGRPEDKQAALAAGFDHHLIKPVTASDIQGLLASRHRDAPGSTA
jgi:two-component system CheB/CheR fusion protein